MLKIVVIDEKASDIEEITSVIDTIPFVEIVGCFLSANEAIQDVVYAKPDVIIMNADVSGISGLVLAQKILEILPNIKIVLIYYDDRYAIDAFEIGICDYLLKPICRERLIRTLIKIG